MFEFMDILRIDRNFAALTALLMLKGVITRDELTEAIREVEKEELRLRQIQEQADATREA